MIVNVKTEHRRTGPTVPVSQQLTNQQGMTGVVAVQNVENNFTSHKWN
jgi:hypothetical protein